MPQAQRVDFDLQHQAGDFGRYRVPNTTCMTQQEILLQLRQSAVINPLVGQHAETGVDAVMGTAIRQGSHNDFTASVNSGMIRAQGFHAGFEVSIERRDSDHGVITR